MNYLDTLLLNFHSIIMQSPMFAVYKEYDESSKWMISLAF